MEDTNLKKLLDDIQLKIIQAIFNLDKSNEEAKMFLFKADGYLESLKDRKVIK